MLCEGDCGNSAFGGLSFSDNIRYCKACVNKHTKCIIKNCEEPRKSLIDVDCLLHDKYYAENSSGEFGFAFWKWWNDQKQR